jgi:type IV pilus assembly protein PilN
MPRINLLPWREEQRKERKLGFLVAIGGGTLAAGVAAFGVYLMFGSMIDGQDSRNEMLRVEIKQLDKQIEEINNLESAKQKFIARMEIIEKLQRSRPEIVICSTRSCASCPRACTSLALSSRKSV